MILFPLNSARDMIKESLFQISQFLKEKKKGVSGKHNYLGKSDTG